MLPLYQSGNLHTPLAHDSTVSHDVTTNGDVCSSVSDAGVYGVDRFRASLHMYMKEPSRSKSNHGSDNPTRPRPDPVTFRIRIPLHVTSIPSGYYNLNHSQHTLGYSQINAYPTDTETNYSQTSIDLHPPHPTLGHSHTIQNTSQRIPPHHPQLSGDHVNNHPFSSSQAKYTHSKEQQTRPAKQSIRTSQPISTVHLPPPGDQSQPTQHSLTSMAIERVAETVSIGPRPSFQKTSVYSQVQYEGYSRHKEEVTFKALLSPVRHADTIYLHVNNTRKRYVTRTYYEPRVKPSSFSETTYNCPKTAQQVFVTYLDQNADDNRNRFKTVVEIRPRRYRSTQTIPSPTDVNSNSLSAVDQTLLDQQLRNNNNYIPPGQRNGLLWDNNGDVSENGEGADNEPFTEIYDPGASQVFIPQRRDFAPAIPHQELVNGQLIMDFSNRPNNGDFQSNGLYSSDGFTDV